MGRNEGDKAMSKYTEEFDTKVREIVKVELQKRTQKEKELVSRMYPEGIDKLTVKDCALLYTQCRRTEDKYAK